MLQYGSVSTQETAAIGEEKVPGEKSTRKKVPGKKVPEKKVP